MGWFTKKPKTEPAKEPAKESPSLASTELFLQLITALGEQSAKRYQAQIEHESKIEELSLKRYEIEVANSEALAKAEASRRAAAEDLRQRRKLAANAHNARVRPAAKAAAECPVCANPSDPALSAMQIQWHHSGHLMQQQPLLPMNGGGESGN